MINLFLGGCKLPVFPCLADKRPACPHGFKDATSDPLAADVLFRQYGGRLIGVPTGADAGFDVLDIDLAGLEWLQDTQHLLPPTRIHHTRSGGRHILFRHHEGLRNSASKIARGVDVRSSGGYIIWWAAEGLAVENGDLLADWPAWLLELAMPHTRPLERVDFTPAVVGEGYAYAALKDAAKKVATAPEGQRNDTLNREAWSLLRFVNDGRLRVQDVINTLAAAGLSSGLARPEIMATLLSALSARGGV